MKALIPILIVILPLGCFAQEVEVQESIADSIVSESPQSETHESFPLAEIPSPAPVPSKENHESFPLAASPTPIPMEDKRWYFEVKPGYFFFTDKDMRQFFDRGGFTFRIETGYKFWGPFMVWVDGGYFQKEGRAIGGTEKIEFKLASITLGLKLIYYFHDRVAVYAGAGPRLLMMMMRNYSPFVRGDDNAIGIGGGFDGGVWLFPIARWPNVLIDLFADYSLKTMKVEPDEISSTDSDVNVSSTTIGIGLGVRF